MKLNKKGFTLAEVIVVSVVIVTVLVTLFTALNRLVSAFETRNRYYDIDAAYLAVEVNNILIEDGTINTLLSQEESGPTHLNDSDINNISNYYKDDCNVYFSLYNSDEIAKISKLASVNQTLKEYIEYLNGNLNYDEEYNYVIISEMCQTEDDCYYYTLKVR